MRKLLFNRLYFACMFIIKVKSGIKMLGRVKKKKKKKLSILLVLISEITNP